MSSANITEFARNAQYSPTSPSSPLQLNADFHRLADTGATSHMTPHCYWFKSYTHFRTPVRLANNTVIYSAGMGNVVFEPIVNGKPLRAVEFSQVLHVPDLRSNFLSCLYLARHKGITINIFSHTMAFRQGRKTLFTASIDSSNLATLDGSTVASKAVLAVSTLPADLSLWHRHFTHHNLIKPEQWWQEWSPSNLRGTVDNCKRLSVNSVSTGCCTSDQVTY